MEFIKIVEVEKIIERPVEKILIKEVERIVEVIKIVEVPKIVEKVTEVPIESIKTIVKEVHYVVEMDKHLLDTDCGNNSIKINK